MPNGSSEGTRIREVLREAAALQLLMADFVVGTLLDMARAIEASYRGGGKLLIFGNGGSAADAQHVAAEFVGRFQRERRGLPAIALTTDSSAVTSISNDYGYEKVFARQIEAFGLPGDVALGISASGNSPNVLAGIVEARKLGLVTLGLTGGTGGALPGVCDHCIIAPSSVTARIQECIWFWSIYSANWRRRRSSASLRRRTHEPFQGRFGFYRNSRLGDRRRDAGRDHLGRRSNESP